MNTAMDILKILFFAVQLTFGISPIYVRLTDEMNDMSVIPEDFETGLTERKMTLTDEITNTS